jgi:hypothetical protein
MKRKEVSKTRGSSLMGVADSAIAVCVCGVWRGGSIRPSEPRKASPVAYMASRLAFLGQLPVDKDLYQQQCLALWPSRSNCMAFYLQSVSTSANYMAPGSRGLRNEAPWLCRRHTLGSPTTQVKTAADQVYAQQWKIAEGNFREMRMAVAAL